MKRSPWTLLALLAVILPGCDNTLTAKHQTLSPSKVLTTYNNDHEDHNKSACIVGVCGDTTQIVNCSDSNTPFTQASNSVMVGYQNSYNKGSGPCPCWAWRSCAFRGYMAFDLTALQSQNVATAALIWSPKVEIQNGRTASNDGNCIVDVYVAKAPWGPYAVPGDALTITGIGGAKSINVSEPVRKWAKGELPNHGFFVKGNESYAEKSNDQCVEQLYNIRLDVVVGVPK